LRANYYTEQTAASIQRARLNQQQACLNQQQARLNQQQARLNQQAIPTPTLDVNEDSDIWARLGRLQERLTEMESAADAGNQTATTNPVEQQNSQPLQSQEDQPSPPSARNFG
jgi:hypothetical protein